MPDINIQHASQARWRRSTRWQWVFGLLVAAVLGWGLMEMVQSARSVEPEIAADSAAAGPIRPDAELPEKVQPSPVRPPPNE